MLVMKNGHYVHSTISLDRVPCALVQLRLLIALYANAVIILNMQLSEYSMINFS